MDSETQTEKKKGIKEKGFKMCCGRDLINTGSESVWIWIVAESKYRRIFPLIISKDRNMFVAVGRFIACRVEAHRKHPVSTDGGTRYPRYAGS
jgi:putative transposase